ncbi:FG-GAP repeat domain-containing protein [Streptomyces sp. NPDC059909]|uniref:FG-GAP repeat domain-containing protein n=1 Tax=Streptomyces sp. NPDC059909 TaxID=3346998 RepID=UPI0036521550
MHHRSSSRRLAAAVLTLSTVTAVTGTLLTVPAIAAAPAPAAVAGATAVAEEVKLPVDAEVVSTGDTGYLTSRKDDFGNTVLEWRTYADGSVLPINSGTMGHGSNSDIVVTSDGAGTVFLRDMEAGSTWSKVFDLAYEFKPGAKLVGVVGANLFVSVPTTGDYQELYQLADVNGHSQKTKLSSSSYNTGYKVVASAGNNLLVLGTSRVFSGATFRTEYWKAHTNVNYGTVIDIQGRESIAAWTPDATGALASGYEAWIEHPSGGNAIVVDAGATRKGFDLGAAMGGAVVVGIVGDVLLYGVPGTAAGDSVSPLYAQDLVTAGAEPYKLLEHFSSAAHAPDGSLVVRGAATDADGLFRVADGVGGARPGVTLVADTGRVLDLTVTGSTVPTAVNLEKGGTTVPMQWTLSRADATVDVTLTHVATGKKLTKRLPQPASGSRFTFTWDGVLDGISAPNGAYTWGITATPTDGVGGPASASGSFQVSRKANPHDFNDNGSTDVLARDAAGVLWRDDLFDGPVNGQYKSARRTKIGPGWQTYKQIEAVGNIGGAAHGDLVGLDGSGVLWLYLGKGDGTFTARQQIGGGWQVYNKLTGGSDLDGDGRSDLVATDNSGCLWFYKGTGSTSKPFAVRKKIGLSGWQAYNQITAVGNVAGGAAGDLVARDKAGVLWLYQGRGDGTFATRVEIGSGWQVFSQLVGAGDVTNDGRPDLIAYGAGGTYVYGSTGSTTSVFTRQTTTLYAGEGSKFNSVS